MYKSLRFIGLCVSLLVFVALLGYVFLVAAKAQPEEVKCPCDYSQAIPKSQSCWTEPFERGPTYTEIFDGTQLLGCQINAFSDEETPDASMTVTTAAANSPDAPTCETLSNNPIPECDSVSGFVVHTSLTPEEVNACQCELLAYVTSLNEVEGITVNGGPPYTCGDVDCSPPPIITTPIPTLNEWGLLAIAGLLGLVGFMVIRRRKVRV